jgi:hypothetical protein
MAGGEMKEKDLTGKELERRVADAYRRMGATQVMHDVEIAGNQIDVYIELPTPGHSVHRIVVEAKDYRKPVGIEIVNNFAQIVHLLRRERLIDEGVIVGTSGFSRPARNAAQTHGIVLVVPEDLDAILQRPGQAKSTPTTESIPSPAPPVDPEHEPTLAPTTAEFPDSPPVDVVQELLLAAFTAQELRRVFLYARSDSPLRPLVNQLSKGDSLAEMVDKVIEFCAIQYLFKELLEAVKKANPRQYARFEGRLRG